MRLSFGICIASWISVFALAWLILLDYLPITDMSKAMFVFFLCLAIISGLQSLPKKPDDKQKM